MRRIAVFSVVLAMALGLGCRGREGTDGRSGTADSGFGIRTGDADFVHDVAMANMAELELGRLAATRAMNAEVKKFAQLMVDDHSKGGDALKTVATQHNLRLPADLDDEHRDLRDRLSGRQNADFDRDYMDAMVDAHEDLADKLESRVDKESLAEWRTKVNDRAAGGSVEEHGRVMAVLPEKSDDAVTQSVNQWAADNYPIVQAHLIAARSLKAAIESGSRGTMP
jgi:predicted outer membrane protein